MPLSSVLGASTLIKPGVVTSSTRPSVPYEGQLIYETDTDRIAAYNGSAWKSFDVNYTDISSTQTFSGFTKGNATVISKYAKLGDFVHFYGIVYLGSTSSMTGPLDVALPVSSDGATIYFPSVAWIGDATAGSFVAFAVGIGTSHFRVVPQNVSGTYAANADVSSSIPMGWAVNDQFSWNYFYKAA